MTKEKVTTEVAEEAPKELSKKKNKNGLVIGLSVAGSILLLAAAVAGYGFWNGNQVKQYALDSEKIMNDAKDWDQIGAFTSPSSEDMFVTIKNDSAVFIAKINERKAPKKAEGLKKDMIAYFTLTKKMATDMAKIDSWFKKMEESTKGLGSASLDATTPEAMAASMEKEKATMVAAKNEMVADGAPEGLEDQYKAFLKLFDSTIAMYDKLIVATRTNDYTAMMSATGDAGTLTSDLDSLGSIDKTLEKIYKVDEDKGKELEKSINNQISSLKLVIFSF